MGSLRHRAHLWSVLLSGKPGAVQTVTPERVAQCIDEGHSAVEVVLKQGSREFAPLDIAVFGGASIDVVEQLIKAGADPNNALGGAKETALHYAAAQEDPAIIRALLEHGGDHSVVNAIGATPLHYAGGLSSNPEVALILLDAGADIDAQDEEGNTPLHWGVLKDNSLAVLSRIETYGMGANLKLRNQEGYTPAEAAKALGNHKAALALDPRQGKRSICGTFEEYPSLAPAMCQK